MTNRIDRPPYYLSSGQQFLSSLAHETGGRFHNYPTTALGDDETFLATEISAAELSLKHCRNYL
jgi:hypothetical protein